MADPTADHPHRDQLLAYGQGLLPTETATALEEHLAGCERCCLLLEQAPGDSFLGRLRDADAVTVPPPIPPELVNHPRYRVLGPVGQGGMGTVYRAEHRRMERQVALKVIHPALMRNPSAVERFKQEARAAARLHHPHIVHAYDADQAGGLHFLVMEYVEGVTLADLVRDRGPLPVDLACDFIRQAALGLQHAHEQGMVHRDIKPHNLMLEPRGGKRPACPPASEPPDCRTGTLARPDGQECPSYKKEPTSDPLVATDLRVKILDFGLARLALTSEAPANGAPAGKLTGVGAVMGTADYIAPEQARDSRAADIRSDIYSLGCTLFHLLTGHPPFADAPLAEKLARHAGSPLPALPDIPAGLTSVLACMTAKSPAQRYPTPAAVAQALLPFCPSPPARPAGNRPLLVASVLLLAAGLLAGAVVLYPRTTPRESVAQVETRESPVTARQVAEKPRPGPAPEPTVPEKPPLTPEEIEAQAADAIRKLGGQVTRLDQAPGKPVIAVKLSDVKVTDADLRAVAAFTRLQTLDLAHTSVTDAGLAHLAGLTNLLNLDLTYTRMTDAGMKHIAEIKTLQSLDLHYTPISDAGVRHLAGLTRLRSLSLYGPRITDAGMADIGKLKSLTTLRLDDTDVTDAGVKHLAGLTELTNLRLSFARGVGDEGMKTVGRLERLRTLDIPGTAVTDAGMKELAGLTQMHFLHLARLKLTDEGLQVVRGMPDLEVLDLSDTAVTDEGLKAVANHPRLWTLGLQGAKKITDAGMKELVGLPRLKVVVLARTNIGDAGLKELAKLPRLGALLLEETKVTDAGLLHLAGCENLTSVSVMGLKSITAAGAAELQKARPRLRVHR